MFLKEQWITTAQKERKASALRASDSVLSIRDTDSLEVSLLQTASQRSDEPVVRLTLEGFEPALYAAEGCVYKGLPAGRKGYYAVFVDCADSGLCLSLIDAIPKASSQTPILPASGLHRFWDYQKMWVLRGFPTRSAARKWIQYYSLKLQIPLLDARDGRSSMEDNEELDFLMRDLATREREVEIRKSLLALHDPDYIVFHNPVEQGPVFAFTAEEPGESPVFRLLLSAANTGVEDLSTDFVKATADLFCHRQGFSSFQEASIALAQEFPGRELLILNRISCGSHLFRRSLVKSAFPMSWLIGRSVLGKIGPVRVLDHELVFEDSHTVLDLRTNVSTLLLSQNLGIEVGA